MSCLILFGLINCKPPYKSNTLSTFTVANYKCYYRLDLNLIKTLTQKLIKEAEPTDIFFFLTIIPSFPC